MAALDAVAFVENETVSGAHDFNAWNPLFTVFARDYLWKPEAFIADEVGQAKDAVAAAPGLNKGLTNALSVKLDQAYKQVEKGNNKGAVNALNAFTNQVQALTNPGKLTQAEAAELIAIADQLKFNLGYWL